MHQLESLVWWQGEVLKRKKREESQEIEENIIANY